MEYKPILYQKIVFRKVINNMSLTTQCEDCIKKTMCKHKESIENYAAFTYKKYEIREFYKNNFIGHIGCKEYIANSKHVQPPQCNIFDEELKEIANTFGKEAQTIKAIEELSELIQALSKEINYKGNSENIAEEMADVQIMLYQLQFFYGNLDMNIVKEKIKRTMRGLQKDLCE